MDENIVKIVREAIKIEEAEAEYYSKLIPTVFSPKARDILMDLLERERIHKIKLEYFLNGTFPDLGEHCPVKDKDFTIETSFDPFNETEQMILSAMNKEVSLETRYKKLSEKVTNPKAVALFQALSREERRHQYYLMNIILPLIREERKEQ